MKPTKVKTKSGTRKIIKNSTLAKLQEKFGRYPNHKIKKPQSPESDPELDTCENILLVADGPSARELMSYSYSIEGLQKTRILAVNYAITWLPKADFYFTLDPDLRQYKIMRNAIEGVRYFAAVPKDYGKMDAMSPNHRVRRLPHVTYLQRNTIENGISRKKGFINTGNSAWGALNLACQMSAKKVLIIGVDGTSDERVSGGKSKNLSPLPRLFSTYDGSAIVKNASPISKIDSFERISLSEGLTWLES